jgi:hypothetical protein
MSNSLEERGKALEEGYFRQRERELIEKMKAKMTADQVEAGLPDCPKCGDDGKMVEVPFEEIKINLCDKCGGAWLDAGELETVAKNRPQGFWARLLGMGED